MALQWYDAADGLIDVLSLPTWEAGQTSEATELRLWLDKGAPTGGVVEDLLVVLSVEDPADPDNWVRSGVAPLDELWCQLRCVGQTAEADPAQELYLTDWQAIGAWRGFAVPAIHSGCARHFELRARVPSSAVATAWTVKLVVLRGEHAVALPLPATAVDRGVVTGIGDPTRSELVRCQGELLTFSQPADAWVQVATREVLIAGTLCGAVAAAVELDQTDGAEEPLVAGQSYWAVLTQGPAALTVTKGLRAAVPVKPAPPLGEVVLARLLVEYGAPLTTGSVDGETLYGRHLALAGDGLEVRIHPGYALAGGTWRVWTGVGAVPLVGSATAYVWQLASGLYEVTAEEVAPDDSSLLLWQVTTDAAAVTALVDRRRYAGRRRLLTLTASAPWAVGPIGTLLVTDAELQIERVVMRAVHPEGATYPQRVWCDVAVNGSTIYPGAAEDDQRPRAELVDEIHEGIPELRVLRDGDVLTWSVAAIDAGGDPPPDTLELYLTCGVP